MTAPDRCNDCGGPCQPGQAMCTGCDQIRAARRVRDHDEQLDRLMAIAFERDR